jgi:hypothetical protein
VCGYQSESQGAAIVTTERPTTPKHKKKRRPTKKPKPDDPRFVDPDQFTRRKYFLKYDKLIWFFEKRQKNLSIYV